MNLETTDWPCGHGDLCLKEMAEIIGWPALSAAFSDKLLVLKTRTERHVKLTRLIACPLCQKESLEPSSGPSSDEKNDGVGLRVVPPLGI